MTETTGTPLHLTGMVWGVHGADPLSLLPKLRRDARENAEIVLREIITDKSVTISQICARTGLALRTINNALQALRKSGVVTSKTRDWASQEVGGKGEELGSKGKELGSKAEEVGAKVDFDKRMPESRKDFRETCRRVWELLLIDESLHQQDVSTRLKISLNSIQNAYAALLHVGLLSKEGGGRGSKWHVNRDAIDVESEA